jgi:uncharacterized protein YkwD
MHRPYPQVDFSSVRLQKKAQVFLYALVALLACLLVVPVATSAARDNQPFTVNSLNSQLLQEINHIRFEHGLQPVTLSPQLTAAATDHSSAMATGGFFSHNTPRGYVFWVRIERYFTSSRYDYWEVGENLVWAAPGLSAHHAVALWMQSPRHRANLLNPRWRLIGLAAVHSDSAPGVYGNQSVTIVTADFGVRS